MTEAVTDAVAEVSTAAVRRDERPAGLTSASAADRVALRVVQLGAIAVVVAASTRKVFELDRFLVPKELVLHIAALCAALLLIGRLRRIILNRVDALLVAYLTVSAVSAAIATNSWLGFRAFAVSASAVLMFWIGRALRDAGLGRPLVHGLALAVIVAAGTSLLQTYGVTTELFSLNRAPGGTLGNRNFVGHAAAFGLPMLLFAALSARTAVGSVVASAGAAVTIGTLVLTRSRAAWIAAAAVAVLFALAMLLAPALRRSGRLWLRGATALVLAGAAVAAALLIPNTLRWRSDNPYLESVAGVVAYDEGSGRGRLVQYEHSLRMAAANPLLGVGPGNWPVEYPRYAARNDPSLNPSEPGTTFNPWPSSDWVAFVAERGPLAAAVLGLAIVSIAISSLRRVFQERGAEDALAAVAVIGTLTAASIAGAFDAVLLLGLPALIVWTAAGALWSPSSPGGFRFLRPLALTVVVIAAGAAVVRSTAQLIAMEIYAARDDRASLERAALIDPANYRVRLRLARGWRNGRCEHALAARRLFPHADAAGDLARSCD